jgi:hypothetical protein
MEVTQAYAVAAGCGIFCLLLLRTHRLMKSLMKTVNLKTAQFLIYPQLVRRHRYLGPWSWAGVLAHVCYIAVNMFCVGFNASSLREASLRAADLALINMIPAFASFHFSLPADLLGLKLTTYRRFHGVLGTMSCCLLGFHVSTMLASRTPFPLNQTKNYWGLIVSTSRLSISRNVPVTYYISWVGSFIYRPSISTLHAHPPQIILRSISSYSSNVSSPTRVFDLAAPGTETVACATPFSPALHIYFYLDVSLRISSPIGGNNLQKLANELSLFPSRYLSRRRYGQDSIDSISTLES